MTYPSKKLGEVCEVVIGGTPRRGVSKYWDDGTLPWVSIADLSRNGREISETKEKITEAGAKGSNVKLLKRGTLLFSFKLSIGKVAFAGADLYTNEAIAGLRIKDEKELDKEYLFYFLQQFDFSGAQKAVKGATLNKSKINNLEILLPPVEVQKKIVEKIEKQFAKIDEAACLRSESEALADQLLPAAVHEIFSPAGLEDWEEKKLEEVTEGVADGTHDTPIYHPVGYPLITSKNLREEGLTFDKAKFISEKDYREINKRSSVKNGDILIGMIGTIGNVTKINTDEKFSIKNVGLVRPDNKKVLGDYIVYFLDNSRLLSLIKTGGSTQKFMSLGMLRKIKIKYPSLAEQKKIVKKLDAFAEKARALRDFQLSQSADLKSLKQSILHQAFT